MHSFIPFLLGTALFGIAFWFAARNATPKRSNQIKPFTTLAFLSAGILFHIFYPAEATPDVMSVGGKVWDKIAWGVFDLGLGLMIGGLKLWVEKHHPKMLWVPGVLAVIISTGMFLFSRAVSAVSAFFCHNPASVELLLEIGADDNIAELNEVLAKYKASATRIFANVDMDENEDLASTYKITVDSALVEPLMKDLEMDSENVDYVGRNGSIQLNDPAPSPATASAQISYKANDPYLKDQWYAEKLAYNSVYDLLKGKSPKKKAKVAILDTGVDAGHEDLKETFGKSPATEDGHGHGTHCAGLAGATTNNKTGMGSLNWEGKYLEVRGYAALSAGGSGSHETIAQAIIDAAEDGADVISMSLGGYAPFGAPRVMKNAIEYARKKGIIVVAAAGNDNSNAKNYSPANIAGVICVAAVDENFRKASFSNTNQDLERPIAAPGVNIFSLNPHNKYVSWNGTSMATPLVAGLLGVMKSLNPSLTEAQAYNILKDTGLKGADSGTTGAVIQPAKALETF